MSQDIFHILEGWEFSPDQIAVRSIRGDDGREKIQMRLDLGLLQMEVDGRPDGQRPQGCESWLDHYRQLQRGQDARNPDGPPFVLDGEACERLLREGIQYYHRYLSFWHLKRYELCARDTTRNLRLFQFVRDYADDERQRRRFDQWRPYVTMMHTRAVATPLVELGQYEAALGAIDAGIRGIRRFLEEYNQSERADQCPELAPLERWRDQIAARHLPRIEAEPAADEAEVAVMDNIERLRLRLAEAISEERFEEAATLRDEIRRLAENPLSGESEG
ncbi:MAG: UvrB/UvrC motif-containing protein [Pirellulales bacterium]